MAKPKVVPYLTRDETTEINGLLTLIQTKRFLLYRNGEPVSLTTDEEAAIIKLRILLAKMGSVIVVADGPGRDAT